ncbi:uncharacterized protein L969DRAFT_95488 [Mixia osmundae IAM 14324]|uniref:Protein kinase domain-containing protein n=1 Tax=Mixia osmundae (strain CBS 9802 / IAM 14324 / JCM 22182 / KY 12970) TaxID=764103 RepID=G7E7J6_MIXOS|nr:uncharacterized protein L969DRAFT_95488 [Mixia osmundae IAM 14324]KEI38408.1 hypothetical protein L969DRAFT_95488 [Mixia osmundae IAM 14324]GAA98806.1 hypothetical protein E5Q_05494 [Mixia osmundae IAM 14324]
MSDGHGSAPDFAARLRSVQHICRWCMAGSRRVTDSIALNLTLTELGIKSAYLLDEIVLSLQQCTALLQALGPDRRTLKLLYDPDTQTALFCNTILLQDMQGKLDKILYVNASKSYKPTRCERPEWLTSCAVTSLERDFGIVRSSSTAIQYRRRLVTLVGVLLGYPYVYCFDDEDLGEMNNLGSEPLCVISAWLSADLADHADSSRKKQLRHKVLSFSVPVCLRANNEELAAAVLATLRARLTDCPLQHQIDITPMADPHAPMAAGVVTPASDSGVSGLADSRPTDSKPAKPAMVKRRSTYSPDAPGTATDLLLNSGGHTERAKASIEVSTLAARSRSTSRAPSLHLTTPSLSRQPSQDLISTATSASSETGQADQDRIGRRRVRQIAREHDADSTPRVASRASTPARPKATLAQSLPATLSYVNEPLKIEEAIRLQVREEPRLVKTLDESILPEGIGDYTFVPANQGGVLGKGKFSSVHIALKGHKKYAVKHTALYPHHPLIASRLLREPAILAELPHHPNLIRVFETIRTPGHFYLVEEYLQGYINLEEYVVTFPDHKLPLSVATSVLNQLVSVVRTGLHSRIQVCHRDIKPENVLINPSSLHVVLFDFGLSTHYSDSEAKLTTCCGSPAYHSPELFLSLKRPPGSVRYHGPEIDIWCIGVTLLRCLTGQKYPLGISSNSLRHMSDKSIDALLSVEYRGLRRVLAGFLDMDGPTRMQAFAQYTLEGLDEPQQSGEAARDGNDSLSVKVKFKSTTFVKCDATHTLYLPIVFAPTGSPSDSPQLDSKDASGFSASFEEVERGRRPSRQDSPPALPAISDMQANLQTSGLNADQACLTLDNPTAQPFDRTVSFLKYALRCAGILYHVVSHGTTVSGASSPSASPYSSVDLEQRQSYAMTPLVASAQGDTVHLRCVIELDESTYQRLSIKSQATSALQAALKRPALQRAMTSHRSSSTPPLRDKASKESDKTSRSPRVYCIAFWLSFSGVMTLPTTPARVKQPRSRKSSNAPDTSSSAPSQIVVRASDTRIIEHVQSALSIGSRLSTASHSPTLAYRPSKTRASHRQSLVIETKARPAHTRSVSVDVLAQRLASEDAPTTPSLAPSPEEVGAIGPLGRILNFARGAIPTRQVAGSTKLAEAEGARLQSTAEQLSHARHAARGEPDASPTGTDASKAASAILAQDVHICHDTAGLHASSLRFFLRSATRQRPAMLLRAILALASHAILLVLAIPTANQHDQLGEDTAISKAALTTKLFNAIEDVAAINHDGLVFEAICTIPVNRQPPLSIKTVGEGSLYFLTKGREGIKLNWQTPTIIKTELGGPEGDKQSDANYLLELILLGAYPPGHKDRGLARVQIMASWLWCLLRDKSVSLRRDRRVTDERWSERYDCVVSLPASYVANQDSAV